MLALFLCIVMVAAVCLAAACQKDKEFKIDLRSAKDWGNDYDETAYTVSNDKDGNLIFDYEKNDTYQLMKRTMVEQVEDLQKVKKIVLVAEMTSSEATPHLLLKLEGTDEVADNPVKAAAEVNITMKSGENTYEWDFRQFSDGKAYDLTKASSLLIFADPGVATAKGKITIKEFYFSDKELDTANAVTLPAKPTPAEKPTYTWQEMKADDFDLTDWQDGGMGVYSVTKDNGTVKVHVDKDAVEGDDKYIALLSIVYGDALKTVKSFRIDIKGTAGTTALIKPFDYKDFNVTFDGTVQHFEFDIASQAARADADFSKKDEPTADNKVAILALQGAENGKADLEIVSAEFSTEPAKAPEGPALDATYPRDLKVDFNTGWHNEEGKTKFTITKEEGVVKATYGANTDDTGWNQLNTEVDFGTNSYNYAIMEVRGTQGTTGIFNVGLGEYKFEKENKFTGEWQTFVVKNYETPVTGKLTIRAYGGFEDNAPAGQIEIRRAEFYYVGAVADGENNLSANGTWLNAAESQRNTIEFANYKTTISYDGPSWDSVLTWVDLGEGGYDHITITVTGTEGHTAIFKVGTIEYKFEETSEHGVYPGGTQTFTIDTKDLKGLVEFRMFFDFGENDANKEGGKFEISVATFEKA